MHCRVAAGLQVFCGRFCYWPHSATSLTRRHGSTPAQRPQTAVPTSVKPMCGRPRSQGLIGASDQECNPGGPRMSRCDRVRCHVRLFVAAAATGLRAHLAHGLSALLPLEPGPDLGSSAPRYSRGVRSPGRPALVTLRRRLHQRPSPQRGLLTGLNPTDRGKSGSKLHPVVDRGGLPVAVGIFGCQHPRQPRAATAGRLDFTRAQSARSPAAPASSTTDDSASETSS